MQKVRVIVWAWNENFNIWKDWEKIIPYDHKKGIEYLALEPNHSILYPQIFNGQALAGVWKKKARLRELLHFLFNL